MEQKLTESDLAGAESAIRAVAQKEGLTAAQVRADMAEAIAAAWNHPDPSIRAAWDGLPHAGEVPTPEELIAWITHKLSAGSGNTP